jgi:hypothetical protein
LAALQSLGQKEGVEAVAVFGGYADVYSTARRSTDVYERDEDQVDRYLQWVLASTEQFGVAIAEFSPWYVERRILEAADEFWSNMDFSAR